MIKNKARFIKAGITKVGNSLVFISPESIAAAHKRIVGKPVYENHNYKEKSRGEVLDCKVEHEWMVGEFTSDKPYKKVSVGYDAVKVKNFARKKYDNIEYDFEMTNLKPYEISGITNNAQRYSSADVLESVRITNTAGEDIESLSGVDNEQVRVYNCVDVDETVEESNKTKIKDSKMFNVFKKEKTQELELDSLVRVRNSAGDEKEITLEELQNAPAKLEEAEKKIAELEEKVEVLNSAEPVIKLDDKEYKAEDVKSLIEEAGKEVSLQVGDKTYSKEELEELIKEATTSDEDVKNSVDKSKEFDDLAKKQNEKINKTLENLQKIGQNK